MRRRLKGDAVPAHLFEAFRRALAQSEWTLADGLDYIHEETGKRILHNRYNEFERGVRGLPPDVGRAMAEFTISMVLKCAGITIPKKDARAIARALYPPAG